jgi:hypothetical protein
MERRAFGFTRATRIGPESIRALSPDWSWALLLPIPIHLFLRGVGLLLPAAATVYHYPVFRVVLANGSRTRHYDAYLEMADADTDATGNTFAAPRNRGNGTSLVGVPASVCRGRNETCLPSQVPPEPGSFWAVLEGAG